MPVFIVTATRTQEVKLAIVAKDESEARAKAASFGGDLISTETAGFQIDSIFQEEDGFTS